MNKKILLIGGSILWILIVLIIIIAIFSSWGWEKHFNSNWQLESKWDFNEEGEKDWKRTEYYTNGQEKSKWKYKDWKENWKRTMYDE